jgi:hypothetical protein
VPVLAEEARQLSKRRWVIKMHAGSVHNSVHATLAGVVGWLQGWQTLTGSVSTSDCVQAWSQCQPHTSQPHRGC